MAGIALYGSLLVNAALAAPPKKKAPVTKPDPKLIAAGKTVYGANGCKGCHKIADAGGATGPNLTKVGADPKHTAKWLEDAVVNPKSHNPDSAMPAYDQIKGKDLKALVAYLVSLK
jgi:cbb3-type cytochrome oxidase cytochrome c subunit